MPTPGDLRITDDNHGGYVATTAALLASMSMLCYAARVYCRTKYTEWGADDYAITLGTVFSLAQITAVYLAINAGFGYKHYVVVDGEESEYVTKSMMEAIEKFVYISQTFYISSLAASKISTSFLLIRLTRTKSHLTAAYICIATTVVWSIGSILLVTLRGRIRDPWEEWDEPTSKMYPKWVSIEVVGLLIEISIVGLAAVLAGQLALTAKIRMVIMAAFGVRLLLIAPVICRIYYIDPKRNLPDPTFLNVVPVAITQCCMHFSLILATIPCLKPFIRPFEADGKPVEEDEEDTRGSVSTNFAHSPDSGLQFMFRKQHQEPELELENVEEGITEKRKSSRLSALFRKQTRIDSGQEKPEQVEQESLTEGVTHILPRLPPLTTPQHRAVNQPYTFSEHQQERTPEVRTTMRPEPTTRITEQDFRMMGITPIRRIARASSWPPQALELDSDEDDEDEDREERLNSDDTLVNERIDVLDTQWPKGWPPGRGVVI